jgi:mRNA interferase MazF
MALVQARLSAEDLRKLDNDIEALGLGNRSEAIREALKLLHRRARHAILAHDYDRFYGTDGDAPVSDVAALGDEIAADAIAQASSLG